MKLKKFLSLFVALVMIFEILPLSSLAAETADTTESTEASEEAILEESQPEEPAEEEETMLLGASADEAEEGSSDASGIAAISEDGEAEETNSEITNASSLFPSGDGTEENPYQVATPEQLDAVRYDLTACYIQVADIDLSGIEWTPIGYSSSSQEYKSFSGQYDGNYHTITGMTIEITSKNFGCFGLFSESTNTETVLRNIVLVSVSISIDGNDCDHIYVGGVIGSCAGTISDCEVSGEISVYGVRDAEIGGLAGSGLCTHCTNYANVYVESSTSSTYHVVECGGICGYAGSENKKITYNINYGNITALVNGLLCGGITGSGGSLSYCVNYGNVYGGADWNWNNASGSCHCYVGGISGCIQSNENSNCINFGNIYASVNSDNCSCTAGGISGCIGGGASSSSVTILNCYNLGNEICANSADGYETFVGRISGGIVLSASNCYSIDTTTVNGVTPAESDTGTSTIHGESMSEAEIASAIKPILDELGLEYDYEYSGSYGSVYYLAAYDESTGVLTFGSDLIPLYTYTLAADVDTTGISDMVGSFVLVTAENDDEEDAFSYTVTEIAPVTTAIGEVTEQNGSTLTIDGTAYPVREDYILGNYEGITLLYHTYEGTIVGYSLPETSTGTLEAWSSSTNIVTIDETDYPVVSVTDLSFLANLDAYLGGEVTLVTYDVSGYTIVGEIAPVEESDDEFDSDTYIIEQVSKYTSSGLYAQYSAIANSDDSWDTKYQKFTELFTKYGFLDVSEGIQYLSSVTSERWAYLTLTNNEMYTCYLYWDWLNNTTKGKATKVLMVADGLVFNNELNTWLNPMTYLGEKDLPGVSKYKDVLYDFMDSISLEIEITELVSLITDISKNTTDAGKVYADLLINKLNNCDVSTELSDIMSSNEAKGVFEELKRVDGQAQFTLSKSSGYGKFSEKVSGVATAFELYTSLVDDFADLALLDAKLAVYCEYLDFLNEVMYSTDLPWEMRLAAELIIQEIDDGAWGEIYDIALDLIDASGVTKIIKEGFFTQILGEAGYASFGEFLTVVNVTSFCINKVFDIGALVKGTAYVEGYAYLSMHYRNKLVESKGNFLLNPTAENAWDFFENYNILYQLRYKGEQAVLGMFKYDGLAGDYLSEWAGYAYKEEVINSILEGLEDCKFIISSDVTIPESVQYSYKAVISCPVDVEVYAPDGSYITTLYDGIESDLTNEYGRFAVVYREYTGTYAKVVCLYQEGDYTFNAIGTDEGLVNFEMASSVVDSSAEYTFTNEEISEGTIFIINTKAVINENTYDVDSDGDGVVDYQSSVAVITEDSYLAVESVNLDIDAVELSVDDSYLLSVTITPSDATRKNVIWVSSDSSVAEIATGKIVAKSAGTATISCISQDNADLIATCEVTVIGYGELIAEAKTTLSSTDWALTQSGVESATGSSTADKISTLIDAILAELDIDNSVTVAYTIADITEAIAGDETDTDGTDGSFTINFTISAGNESDTLAEAGTITATAYAVPEHIHTLTRFSSVAASCSSVGNIEYWYCSGCDTYFSDAEAKTAISLADTVTPKIDHSYGEGAVTKAAACTTSGEMTYTCSECGATKTETIPATGHSYSAEVEVIAPTYTEQGYTLHTCINCGDSYKDTYTDILVLDGTDSNVSTKTMVQALTALPDGLKGIYSSVDALIADLVSRVTVTTGYTEANTAVYDVYLQYSVDGEAWATATVDNFPVGGITVTIPYPEGTDSSYEFTVLHMFTETSARLGTTTGETESPTVAKTDDGLVVALKGTSPVAVSWKAVTSTTTTTSAKTGDSSHILIWMILMLMTLTAAGGIFLYTKKKM